MIDVQDAITDFCETVGWDSVPIPYMISQSLEAAVSSSVTPEVTLIVGAHFKDLEEIEQVHAVNEEMCLLLARLKFENRKIQPGSPEWRYFAFKSGVLEEQSQVDFNTLQVLVEEW